MYVQLYIFFEDLYTYVPNVKSFEYRVLFDNTILNLLLSDKEEYQQDC